MFVSGMPTSLSLQKPFKVQSNHHITQINLFHQPNSNETLVRDKDLPALETSRTLTLSLLCDEEGVSEEHAVAVD